VAQRDVIIKGGDGLTGNASGGDLLLSGGDKAGTGIVGNVKINNQTFPLSPGSNRQLLLTNGTNLFFGSLSYSDISTGPVVATTGVFSGNITSGGNQVLLSSNYNSYAPTLTGTGASGTWGINVTGNSASATTSASCSGNAATATTASSANAVAWTNVSGRPTNVSSFSNDMGYLQSGGGAFANGGLCEVGRYLDFHSGTGSVDFDVRIDVTGNGNGGQGTMSISGNALSFNNSFYAGGGYIARNGTGGGGCFYYGSAELIWCNGTTTSWGYGVGTNQFQSNSYFANSLSCGTSAMGGTGVFLATNNIVAYYSDRRLKENIKPIENALYKISKISGVTYNSNDLAESFGYSNRDEQVGVIAQEIQAVLPHAVKAAPFDLQTDEDGVTTSKSGENYLTVQYEKLVPLLIQAIKEQQAQIDELKATVQSLK
jgi:hypothetical protein